jgi:hypothetical protein
MSRTFAWLQLGTGTRPPPATRCLPLGATRAQPARRLMAAHAQTVLATAALTLGAGEKQHHIKIPNQTTN